MTGEQFRAIRLSMDLTQGDLASLLGYAHGNHISDFEKDRAVIPLHLGMLMDAFASGYRPAGWPAGDDWRKIVSSSAVRFERINKKDMTPKIKHHLYKRGGKQRWTWLVTYYVEGRRKVKWCVHKSEAEEFVDGLVSQAP